MRIFLAVFPPAPVQAAVADAIARVRRQGDGLAWVRRENLHYTLRFMGELDERRRDAVYERGALARVITAAREGVTGVAPFDALLGAADAFPAAQRARVLWLGLAEGGEALVALAAGVERALVAQGFAPAARPFAPHLTIARVRARDQDWSGRLQDVGPDPAPRFRVDRVRVIESTLASGAAPSNVGRAGAAPSNSVRAAGSKYAVRAEAVLAS